MNRTVHTRFASFAQGQSLRMLMLLATLLLSSIATIAQTTSFTYQGRLTDAGNPANGSYDLQVKLFDALTGGTQIGATNSLSGVAVSGGVFTVTLDFGAAAFPGANRWAEISAKAAGSASFTTLTPRQPVTSTPYAIKSLSAATADNLSASCTGCVTGAQIGSLPATSGNYIQNTTTQQANSNFFISQVGTAGQDLNAGREITVDFGGTFNGNFSSFGGLRFGNTGFQTGEGIASKRTAGGNQFGLDFYTNYLSRLTITNSGNVGIGTTSPTGPLHVVTTQNSPLFAPIIAGGVDNVLLSLSNIGTGGKKWSLDSTGGGSGFGQGNLAIWNGADFPATPTMLLQSNGNVGIGTNTPGSLLTLKSGSATATALEVNQGGIKVTGAGINTPTAVFTHEVTAGNIDPTDARTTIIDNPLTNGDVKAILIVTTVLLPGRGVFKPAFIDYNTAIGKWRIIHTDLSQMTAGENFNVLVVKP